VIEHIDRMLRHLMITRVAQVDREAQVRFQPPDADWRTYVANLDRPALNVYLVELRENRDLRTNERFRAAGGGAVAFTRPGPCRVDLHYLITAWSPAAPGPAVEPTLDEHALLYRVSAALVDAGPLIPAEIYRPEPPPAGFPAAIADAELPTEVLPAEGFSKYAEFWGTMGNPHPWRPAVYLVVTVPIESPAAELAPPVTVQTIRVGTPEAVHRIGGTVSDPAGAPVPGAWVRVETPDGATQRTVTTTESGRYVADRLRAGRYRVRVRVAGLGEQAREIDVPGEGDGYDVTFG
jgi:Pvc16 N-terminal domain/Carboxypeptidase regulatory-like domain